MLDGVPHHVGGNDPGIAHIHAQHDDVQHLGIAHFKRHLGDGDFDHLHIVAGNLTFHDGAVDEQLAAGKNILLRSKEDAQDYRYFPEPDLKTIYVEESRLEELKASIPELPNDKLLRLMKQYKLPYFDANLMAENPDKADYFEAVAALGKCQPKNISNWLLGDITRIINEKNLILADTKLSAEKLADMLAMIETGEISTTAGKTVLEEIIFSDKTAADVVEEKGLRQMNDTGALEQVVSDILAANPKVVEDYRGGKTNALGFLVGQCMRASKGKGNPNILREMLEKALNS